MDLLEDLNDPDKQRQKVMPKDGPTDVGRPTADELDLLARDVPVEAYNIMLCLRVMTELARDKKVPLTEANLSKRSGLSRYTIRCLMNSEQWNVVFNAQIKNEVGMILKRCLGGIDELLVKHQGTPLVLDVTSKMTTLYKTLAQIESKRESTEAEDTVMQMLDQLEKDGKLKRAGILVTDT